MGIAENNASVRSIFKIALDAAAIISILYIPFYGVWVHYHPSPAMSPSVRVQTILLVTDIIPCVASIIWLLYRHIETLTEKCPFVVVFLNSTKLRTLGIFALVALTILVKTFWR